MEMYMTLDFYEEDKNINKVLFYKAEEKTEEECIAYFKALVLSTFYATHSYHSRINYSTVKIKYCADRNVIQLFYTEAYYDASNEKYYKMVEENYYIQKDTKISKEYINSIFNNTNPVNLALIDKMIIESHEFFKINNKEAKIMYYNDNGELVLRDTYNKED